MIDKLTQARYGYLHAGMVLEWLNRTMLSGVNYFDLGLVGPANNAIIAHMKKRLGR